MENIIQKVVTSSNTQSAYSLRVEYNEKSNTPKNDDQQIATSSPN